MVNSTDTPAPRDAPERVISPPPGRVHVWLAGGGDPQVALRRVLAWALSVEPAAFEIVRDSHGRPHLAGDTALDFNLSHSGGLALIALASDRRVGVDLERIVPRPRWPGIAARYFSGGDLEAIHDLPERERLAAFYARWTKTEAWVKLTGEGLGSRGPMPARAGVRGLSPAPGYAGAVAAEGGDWELDFWRLPAAGS